MIKHLSLKAYGKINLGLDVLRRREDGYHDVRMIMQTVGIFDRVDLVWKEEPDWKLTDRKTEKRNCGERHFIRSWMQ